jgi:hypothetical protein
LIAYGILTIEDAAGLLGFSKTDSFLAVFNGATGTSEEKTQRMWDTWKARKEELAEKKKKARELFSIPNLKDVVETSLFPPATGDHEISQNGTSHLPAVVKIMEGMLDLLGDVNRLKPEDLVPLQGSESTILKLSATLSALGSRLITSKSGKGVSDGHHTKQQ